MKHIEPLLEFSPFLKKLHLKYTGLADAALNDPHRALLSIETGLAPVDDTGALMTLLRQSREKIAFVTAVADLSGRLTLEEVTTALSRFADACIRLCLDHQLKKYSQSEKILLPADGPSIAVFALGKLGAHELNYSSDIDILFIYDEQKILTPDPHDQPQIFVRIVREVARMLDEKTADGYVFRTDLRLRPDAAPVAVSLGAAETYYGSFGQNWERAAMIKARHVAGDGRTAEDFMKMIRAWIWRKNLDFAAIQDIHSIKRQINAHRNLSPDALKKQSLAGHNVKLGRGGIREIEFFVQTQQLIFGGRDPRLRTDGTISALLMLEETGHITSEIRKQLCDAYVFLRNTEHRLQMIDDRQTHSLPESAEDMESFALFSGYDNAEQFQLALRGHLLNVEKNYAALFENAPSLATGPGNLVFTGTEDDPETIKSLRAMGFENPSAVASTIRSWHHGRYRAMRSERARQLLTELVPALLKAFAATPGSDDAFLRFDKFLAALPSGIPVFSFFYQNPQTLELVAEIMGIAPEMAEHLNANPQTLEALLSRNFFSALPSSPVLEEELDRLMETAEDYEGALDTLRRWARDKRFHAGVHVIMGLTDAAECGPFLTSTAEICLKKLLARAEDEFALVHGRIEGGKYVLLGYGRLGAVEMGFASDLDLVAVYDAPENAESDGKKPLSASAYYARMTQRLITAVTALTAEGRLYEIDMRLRPDGEKGPLAVSLEGFVNYYQDKAWTWELMSLTRARPVAGDRSLKTDLSTAIQKILVRPREQEKLWEDIALMRRKIAAEFGTDNLWSMKQRPGGLTDILFIVQYLLLTHASKHPDILDTNLDQCIKNLSQRGLLPESQAHDMLAMLCYARRAQNFLRLSAKSPFKPEDAPNALKSALARTILRDENGDFEHAQKTLWIAADKVRDCFDALFSRQACG